MASVEAATAGERCEVAVDCSGQPGGRHLAILGTARWGRVGFVGEGNTVQFEPSPDIIHKQITIFGSWVTSIAHMEDAAQHLGRLGLHPESIVTDRFPLGDAAKAYELMDRGECGKVAIVF